MLYSVMRAAVDSQSGGKEIVLWLNTHGVSEVLTSDKSGINFKTLRAKYIKTFLESKQMTELNENVVQDYEHNLTYMKSILKVEEDQEEMRGKIVSLNHTRCLVFGEQNEKI